MAESVLDAPDAGVMSDQAPSPLTLRSPTDLKAARQNIYSQVHKAFATTPPVSDARHTLALSNVRWVDPENVPVPPTRRRSSATRRWPVASKAPGR